jgi:hypothetical protein
VRLFHSTTREAADAILAAGFRDAVGTFMTTHEYRGVWLADQPLDENEGASSEALLAVDIDEALVAPFEWVEDGKGYREFLVPASLANEHTISEIPQDD